MTPDPRCRIGKVRPKASPHLVEIIPAKRGLEYRRTMHRYADEICDSFEADGIAGFALIAWGFEGRFSRGTRIHADSFVGATLLPGFAAEILRRDVSADIAAGVFRGEF